MLKRIFSYDNPVFQAIYTIGQIVVLNFLWMICSIPVFTIGASTTALMYSCIKLHKKEGALFENFFGSFKQNFKQATALFFIFFIVGVVIIADMILGNQARSSFGTFMKVAACVAAIPYFITLLYVFGVQSRFVNTVKDTIRYSFFLALRNIKTTIQLALIVVLLVAANMLNALIVYLTIMFGAGFVAYCFTAYYNRVFAQYLPKDETDGEEDGLGSLLGKLEEKAE